jgi:type II secretory pathway component PulF
MKYDEFAFLNQQLAGMLRDGIPLEGALRQLCKTMQRGRLRAEFEKLESDLARGIPLNEALQERKFPDLYGRMIAVGMKSDDLPGVLTLLADYYQTVNSIGTRLKGLMVYPVIVLVASLVLSLWLAVVLSGLFKEFGGFEQVASIVPGTFQTASVVSATKGSARQPTRAPPATKTQPTPTQPAKPQPATAKPATVQPATVQPTKASLPPQSKPARLSRIGLFGWINLWLPPLVLAAVAGLVAVSSTVPSFRRLLRWRLPAFKEASLAQFGSAMALMLKSGCPFPEALALARALEKGTPAARELAQWQSRAAAGHKEFADLAGSTNVFPPLFVWLVSSAGEDIAAGFDRAKAVYQVRAVYRIELLLYAALPVSLMLLGAMIIGQIYPFFVFLFRQWGQGFWFF